MIIAIRKEPYGVLYIDKNLRAEINYIELGFTLINVDDKYADCESQDFNEDFTFNVEKYNARKDSYVLEDLRARRETECFPIINRGALWYNTLTEEQLLELQIWYDKWLNVTQTQWVPERPSWIK